MRTRATATVVGIITFSCLSDARRLSENIYDPKVDGKKAEEMSYGLIKPNGLLALRTDLDRHLPRSIGASKLGHMRSEKSPQSLP